MYIPMTMHHHYSESIWMQYSFPFLQQFLLIYTSGLFLLTWEDFLQGRGLWTRNGRSKIHENPEIKDRIGSWDRDQILLEKTSLRPNTLKNSKISDRIRANQNLNISDMIEQGSNEMIFSGNLGLIGWLRRCWWQIWEMVTNCMGVGDQFEMLVTDGVANIIILSPTS